MSPARYEELLGILFDDTLSPGQADELAAGLQSDPGLLRDLQEHLILWELCSQALAPERSADAFVAGWRTRLRAESESAGTFDGRVLARVAAARDRGPLREGFLASIRQAAGRLRRPLGIAWAAAGACVAVVAIAWLIVSHPARAAVVIRGEAVCTACTLHEGHTHDPAMRVTENGVTRIYSLDRTPSVSGLQDYFCNGPAPATAEGTVREQQGQLRFSARSVSLPTPPKPSDGQKPDQRILFPI